MKKVLLFILIAVSLNVQAQKGELVPDSAKAFYDTIRSKAIVYISTGKLSVDSGYCVRKIAPVVFSGDGGSRVATDQQQIIEVRYFVLPKKSEISWRDVVFFRQE